LWPFGFGLSYTKFEYANLGIVPAQGTSNQDVAITFDVTNAWPHDGDEIPQLYVHQMVSSTITWEQSLRGFDRIHLKSGETKTVTFHLSPSTLAIWNRDMVRVVEPGSYEIQIGASSTDLRLKGALEIH
jgi:beta-glucosidase